MVDKLNLLNIGKTNPIQQTATQQSKNAEGNQFKDVLMNSIDEVNRLQQEAQTATEKLMTGETNNPAEVFSAVKKADIAFSLLMQIRNQLVDAYTEVRNMRL